MHSDPQERTRSASCSSDYFAHSHGDSSWTHGADPVSSRVLGTAVVFTLSFSAVELFAGLWSNSLALVGDAGHMAADSAALVFALLANVISRRGADWNHSFGHGRVEVLCALLNCLAILAVVVWLVTGAVGRLQTPEPIDGRTVTLVACLGLVVNAAVAWTLSRGTDSMNVRAALANVLGDLLGSAAAVVSGAAVWIGGEEYSWVDPLLSFVVCGLLVHAVWGVLLDALAVLLDAVPRGVRSRDVGQTLETIPGVVSVHDLHVWTMAPGHGALTAHLVLARQADWLQVLSQARAAVRGRFGIDHVTLQPEPEGYGKPAAASGDGR